MKLLKKDKEKEFLKYVKERIETLQKCYTKDRSINLKQKQRLDYFVNRPLDFIKTKKQVNYEKEKYIQDKDLVVTAEQVAIYKFIKDGFKNLIIEVYNSNEISSETRAELNRNIAYVLSHITGKLYCRKRSF